MKHTLAILATLAALALAANAGPLAPVVWIAGAGTATTTEVYVANYHIQQFPDRETAHKNLTFAIRRATWDDLTNKKQEKIKAEIEKCLTGQNKLNQARVDAILASLPKEPTTQLELTDDPVAYLHSLGLQPPPGPAEETP